MLLVLFCHIVRTISMLTCCTRFVVTRLLTVLCSPNPRVLHSLPVLNTLLWTHPRYSVVAEYAVEAGSHTPLPEIVPELPQRSNIPFQSSTDSSKTVRCEVPVTLHASFDEPSTRQTNTSIVASDLGDEFQARSSAEKMVYIVSAIASFMNSALTTPSEILTVLDLVDTGMGDEEALVLAAALPQCTALTELSLNSNGIGPVGAIALAAAIAAHCTSLTTLVLDYTIRGDADACAWGSELARCSGLKTLHLHAPNYGSVAAIGMTSRYTSLTSHLSDVTRFCLQSL